MSGLQRLQGCHALPTGAGGGVGMAVPLGRKGDPKDIAGAAVLLASAETADITAPALKGDGGAVMS